MTEDLAARLTARTIGELLAKAERRPFDYTDHDDWVLSQLDPCAAGEASRLVRAARIARKESEEQRNEDEARQRAYFEAVKAVIRPARIEFRTRQLALMNSHAIHLAFQNGISVKRCRVDEQSACPATRTIATPPVTNQAIYAAFLHEAAHILSPSADATQYRYAVISDRGRRSVVGIGGEIGAWAWAAKHAISWTTEMQDTLVESLLSYAPFATEEGLDAITSCVTSCALGITDRPWTFDDLERRCDVIRLAASKYLIMKDAADPVTDLTEKLKMRGTRQGLVPW